VNVVWPGPSRTRRWNLRSAAESVATLAGLLRTLTLIRYGWRLLAFAAVISLAVPATGAARVPGRFVGVEVDGPLFPTDSQVDLAAQMDTMVASGVESIRIAVDWADAQPYSSWSQVPAGDAGEFKDVGGIPTRFGRLDQIVALAAQHGLTVLPTVLDAPGWDGLHYKGALVTIPRSPLPYAAFVRALVQRYGPTGSFWHDHGPAVPIRVWQIWNEPNITAFWPPQPFEPKYVRLLRAAHAAIKGVDPRAKVVLAGMPNFSWVQLASIYKVRGARKLFDVVALHPYTRRPQGVITILTKARQVMNAAGDGRKPIIADEISWPSSLGKTTHSAGFDFATTEAGQAKNLATLLPALAKERVQLKLVGFYYYTWAGYERPASLAFDFSGLWRFTDGAFVKKPVYDVFRRWALALDGCRQKGTRATVCLRH
jgi:hypothetical protein